MEKINVAEILKDCPSKMELDCTICNGVKFIKLNINSNFPIVVRANNGYEFTLTKYGQLHNFVGAKCIIYPKGKTTWEGFVPPCKFKDGDVLSYQYKGFKNRTIYIYMRHGKMNTTYYVALSGDSDSEFMINNQEGHALNGYNDTVRHATEEEKQKLFQAIKDNGYKWNEETKTLEELIEPKFHVGDWVVFNNQPEKGSIYQVKDAHNYEYTLQHILGGSIPMPFSRVDMLRLWTIDDAKDGDVLACNEEILLFKSYSVQGFISLYCWYNGRTNNFHSKEVNDTSLTTRNKIYPATKEQRDFLFQKIKEEGYKWNAETKTLEKLIIPKFKVGDRIRHKITNKDDIYEISKVYDDSYGLVDYTWMLYMEYQDNYELVPNKFDITTLKPFDKVLVRCGDDNLWQPQFFAKYRTNSTFPFVCTYNCWSQCIPYEGNEHLLGTNDDCDEYYKTWK